MLNLTPLADNIQHYGAHAVCFVTEYLYPCALVQHLLSAEAQPLPQQELSLAQAKLLPIVFVQHVPPGATQMSPQQIESLPHKKESPCVLIHFTLSSSNIVWPVSLGTCTHQ